MASDMGNNYANGFGRIRWERTENRFFVYLKELSRSQNLSFKYHPRFASEIIATIFIMNGSE